MTHITRISRLHGSGIFRDFKWPEDLLEFKQYNLIYGWNGTGKTTLSRVLRALELRQPPTMGEAVLRIDGNDVRGAAFPQSTLHIRVFNRDFISESVFRATGGDIPPIFVVGKESVEKQKEADRLKSALRTKEGELNSASATEQQSQRNLDKHCIDRAKVIKDTLRASGSVYSDYDKGRYRSRAQQMVANGNAVALRLSDSERGSLLAQHRATRKQNVLELTYRFPDLQGLADKVAALLGTTVVSAAIQALKDDSGLAEWTRHGLGLHKERKTDSCLFCEQPLPKSRLAELEAHFNAQYDQFLQNIKTLIQELESVEKQAAEVKLPDRAKLYDDLATDFDAAQQALRQALDTVQAFVGELVKALKGKKAKPFEALTLSASVPTVDAAVVDRLNKVIHKHNQACDDFARRVSEARDRLASDMIAESVDEFVRLNDELQKATAAIGLIKNEIAQLKYQITQLERDIKEHQRPAEELNEDLKQYLGHGELQLTLKDTGYAITRNGVPADMLSEGEMTAIALLYFLKSLEDRGFDKANGVVVIDDPVSSLDANALYLAYGFIQDRTQGAGQLFILTHNFGFFRHVRDWFHYLNGRNKRGSDRSKRPERFYMLDCAQGQDGRCASIRWLDPLLEQYDSEYHYLFARVHRVSTASGKTDLEENYVLPNIARRLLETFLAFRQPQETGVLRQKVKAVSFDEAKKMRILRFLNTHSHSSGVGEPEHDLSVLAEGRAVLRDLLEMIRSQDEAHFAAMVQLVAPSSDSEDNE